MSPPLDMPIAISANFLRFELVVNLNTAKDIGHEVPKVFSHARSSDRIG
jgi:hypothetical protein